jgi:hypothetical protein
MMSLVSSIYSCNSNTMRKSYDVDLTVKEIGSHQQLQGNLGCNGKLRYLSAAVSVAHLVSEVHAHLLQNV